VVLSAAPQKLKALVRRPRLVESFTPARADSVNFFLSHNGNISPAITVVATVAGARLFLHRWRRRMHSFFCSTHLIAVLFCLPLAVPWAGAVTTVFFNSSQTTNLVSTNATSDTLSSEGYLFTYTRDKLFTGGTTNVIGRPVRVYWPDGLEAQYVTAGPTPGKAQITVQRIDGAVFDLTAFTARLLANAGAGRAIEIVPKLNGEEPLNDPLYFDVSGVYGNEFSYDTSPNYLGTTAALTNYDTYVIDLTLDYALVSLTVVDASIPPPVLDVFAPNPGLIELSWPVEAADYVLESITNLSTQVWSPITNSPVFNGSFYSVQLETTGAHQLFRLRK